MYPVLLQTHSFLRFLVLIFLVIVIAKAYMGMSGKKPFGKTDNLLGLLLFSLTHTQLLVGLILYTQSPWVKLGGDSMKDPGLRFWTVEHGFIMLIAIVLITMARITAKKLANDDAKHRRMLVFNTLAFIFIMMGILMSGRGIFAMTNPVGQ